MKAYLQFVDEITGYGDVLETVEALEKIAASSIHQMKSIVSALTSYHASLVSALARLQELNVSMQGPESQAVSHHPADAVLIVGGDQGLVGGLYHALVGAFLGRRADYPVVFVIGSRTAAYIEEEGIRVAKAFPGFSATPTRAEIEDVSHDLLQSFNVDFGHLDILYPSFVSLMEQTPVFVPFLPFSFSPPSTVPASVGSPPAAGFPIYEPAPKKIVEWYVQRYVEVAFRKIVLDAKLSELSARTVASEQAAEKTRDIIHSERRAFFRAKERWLNQSQLERFSAGTHI